jgi:uncharacterized protein (DUF2267 family)
VSSTGLDTFDTTIQETNHWLRIVMAELETDNRRMAYTALRASLHALRDRIGPEAAVHLGAQLPTLLRGVYYEGWRLSGMPTRERHADQFLDHVANLLPRNSDLNPEEAVHAVFVALTECIDTGEVAKLLKMLPREIKSVWLGYVVEKPIAQLRT